MPGNAAMTERLAAALGCTAGIIATRKFPDSETYLRYETDVRGRNIALVCTLDRPDGKILPLLFAARTAKDLGAAKVSLIAPYLAYMRQDRSFHPGEAVSSRYMAALISGWFDALVAVDPHLHRYHALSEIYSIPAAVVHAAPELSAWTKANVADPFLIGPDEESAQWVSDVARDAGAPFTTLVKARLGDRKVEVRHADLEVLGSRTPVLVDDIVSSGRTMLEAVKLVKAASSKAPVCIAVHGIFADHSDDMLAQTGAEVVTTNTIPHPTNRIDLTRPIAAAIQNLL
ncbi:MAG TPA: ribose-phosphate pyrophosphokinase [Rhizomicrobium sp.]|nr:ribose-phosphate pyrophosphokinase [Rhizomicrobium sp.]